MAQSFSGREHEPMELDAEFNAAPFMTLALHVTGTTRTKLIERDRFRPRFTAADLVARASTETVVKPPTAEVDKR